MATSSFTSSVIVNKQSATSIKRVMNKTDSKPNTKDVKKVDRLKKEEIKNFRFR